MKTVRFAVLATVSIFLLIVDGGAGVFIFQFIAKAYTLARSGSTMEGSMQLMLSVMLTCLAASVTLVALWLTSPFWVNEEAEQA